MAISASLLLEEAEILDIEEAIKRYDEALATAGRDTSHSGERWLLQVTEAAEDEAHDPELEIVHRHARGEMDHTA